MRGALVDVIESETQYEIVGEAVNGRQALELALKLKPQMILMDLLLPVMDGIEATREILRVQPEIKILMITSSSEVSRVAAAIRAGALGYITKDSSLKQIRAGLREVANGRRFIPPEIGEKLARAMQAEEKMINPLTGRENDVLALVGEGKSNLEIAQVLHISEGTTRVHISNIMRKLNLKNRSQVAVFSNKNLK